uniref:Uncharacterized protein n=1 Tax=Parascaris equorum TaxID=6256 RepID=A0A914RS83_PAREQ
VVTDRVELVTVAEEFALGDSVLSDWRATACFISPTNQNILVFKFRADEFAIGEKRRLVDASIGMCVLRAHNLISTRNSVLAKVELLRIRSIVSGKTIMTDAGGISDDLTHWPSIYLRPMRNRNVQLECDQHDSYCFSACGNAFSSCSNVIWISDPIADLPEWPLLPLFCSSDTAYLPRNFVENPYPLGYSIPGCIEFTFIPSTSGQPISTSGTFSMSDLNLNEMLHESRALVCTVAAHPPVISHDFSVRRWAFNLFFLMFILASM